VPERNRRGRPPAGSREADASRRELLDAAAVEFSARGYEATTVDGVCKRAGLSKGTFYWNFASKEELFAAVIEQRVDVPVRAAVEEVAGAPPERRSGADVGRRLAELVVQDPDAVGLVVEHWSASRRDEALAERYRQRHRDLRALLAAALEARHEQTGVPLTTPADQLAEGFVALATGLGMAAVVDQGSVSPTLFGEVAGLVYDGLVHRAQCAEG
jgi:AcrR family transcriptional regulator